MKTIIRSVLFLGLFIAVKLIVAQPWMTDIHSESPTLSDFRKAFYDYWEGQTIEKGKGYNQFKRWEWYWETRVLPDGRFPSPSVTWDEWHKYVESHPDAYAKSSTAANWEFKGPSTTPGGYNGLGRLNCIAFHPTNANTFWVGSPAGGLWKTTNGGSSWTTNTDNLPVLGVSDIAIDPTNPNTMYVATGDGNLGSLSAMTGMPNGDTKSVGVLKSTNGGTTWSTTGLNWSQTSAKLIKRLLINPNNPQILIAAASDGIWRTTNGGVNWTNVQPGYFMDLEFKPGDPATVYAATYSTTGNSAIYRSLNGGASWSMSASLNGVIRIKMAVTPNYPDLVDAVCVDGYGGLAALIYSVNSGASFSIYYTGTNSNNLLHSSFNASGQGGQGWYDLAYAINPGNANEIWLGGVNTWKTTDGGSWWYLNNYWTSYQNPGVPVVHADKHFFAFHPLQPNTIFECNDGGLYKSTNGGATWTDLSNGLEISQLYRIGVSQTIPNNVICGLQDNGSREIYNNQWYEQTGGDGMECIIDYVNADTEYASYAYGMIYRTYDFWQNVTTISDNIPGQPAGAWVTPFVLHPTNPNTMYAGYKSLYKTTNQGNSWTAISPVMTSDYLRSIAVAPSNANTIYTATFDTLFLTTDGGTNWYYVPVGIPDARITYIAVHPAMPQTVWITLAGYNAGQKVYKTTDGGANWTNISGSLPNLPVNCIVYQKGSNDGLYIGTDVGVFYRNAAMTDWIPYQTGLPNVVVTELEISYSNNKLWAATFGRGLWNSDLHTASAGIETRNIEPTFAILPNPASGQFIIEVHGFMLEKADIAIFDLLGHKVWEGKQGESSQVQIDLSHESPGIYFVHLGIGKNKAIQKLALTR